MLSIGVDAHKRVHHAVAVDEAGRVVAQWRGPNSGDGWQAVQRWAAALGPERQWGIEGAWNYGRGLAQFLVPAGESVYEINPRWTAAGRRTARQRGKSDSLDGRSIALLVWREGPSLPRVYPEDDTVQLDLLVIEREGILGEITRLRAQLHHLLLQLDPEYATKFPKDLACARGLAALERYTADQTGLADARAAVVHRAAERLRVAVRQVEALEAEIRARATAAGLEPLTRVCGINLLTAAALAGILGPGDRFRSDAELAAYAGAAPLEASSAAAMRHRLNRGGNRRLNAILYRIAVTQARHPTEGRAYLDRRRTEGKSTREAMRALKRFLVRRIWRLWQECLAARRAPSLAIAA